MSIEILDTTLRDGGYINNWEFDDEHIVSITKSLIEANCEIIECGYLSNKDYTKDSTLFDSVKSIEKLFNGHSIVKNTSKIYFMVNFGDFDIGQLQPKKDVEFVDGIRLAFHKKDYLKITDTVKKILSLGYEICVQPMVTKCYHENELIEITKMCNELNVTSLYIVDSFGDMDIDTLEGLYNLINTNLNKDIKIGLHLHNNLQSAFSNAQYFLNMVNNRSIILDSSVSGIGRGAGNLNTEIIFNLLNSKYQKNYENLPLLTIIDDYLDLLRKEYGWGYSIAYYLSAIRGCHPNYASFLVNKKNLTVSSIKHILDSIADDKLISFDKNYAQELFDAHLYENKTIGNSNLDFLQNREVLLIASGKSTVDYKNEINQFIKREKPLVIALNHIPDFQIDYCFFSNEKRFEEFYDIKNDIGYLVTSNIVPANGKTTSIPIDKIYNGHNNVAILALNLLINEKIKEAYIVGLDGYNLDGLSNYSYKEYSVITNRKILEDKNNLIKGSLKQLSDKIQLNFLTPSQFNI